MTRKNLLLIAGVAALGLTAATGLAVAGDRCGKHGHGDRAGQMMERMDADKDGQITREEFDAQHGGMFARADADGDGKVTREEAIAAMTARIEKRVDAMFERMDADKDGAITKEEMAQGKGDRHARMFERLDDNGDGVLSKDELEKMKMRGGKHDGRGEHDGRGKHGERGEHGCDD